MRMIHKFIMTVCITTTSIMSASAAYASVAEKDSKSYESGKCITGEVVKKIHIGTDYQLSFKVGDKWFAYENNIKYADAQAAHKLLVASLLTGNTIDANYGGYSCYYEKVSNVYLNEN